ncbi:DUF72 domain-containing protein [Piscinibacter aquaticus]|uniref:DUF72 domain-containing protein n=1 Tax=Piscinibacter aquaticus TaxID=392597 RepID=A0A5C6TZN9_9BURK|nr:DUF72 domain-containing protein [Piscinibacter aquaticus]
MQEAMFPETDGVLPAAVPAPVQSLAAALPSVVRLGTSSWTFPGWAGLVYAHRASAQALARDGLPAYGHHPLLRTVSLDRSFYWPLEAAEYAACAQQVPDDFRFVVKAPARICDAVLRDPGGRGARPNPLFLDAQTALGEFVRPAMEGLGEKLGALVFQISPLPAHWLSDREALFAGLDALLHALPPGLLCAVEVRDAAWLGADFAALLRARGATYCLGLHPRLPPIDEQLPMLRALWPGPLVCRWNLHRRHGAQGYESAKAGYEPFDRLVDPDPGTREVLARVAAATSAAGQPVYVTINNKAEGSAPCSVIALAEEIARQRAG